MTLAQRLQRLIAKYHMSQSNVADAAGMTRQQISRIINGSNAEPKIATVERIVEAIGSTMVELYQQEQDR